MERLGFVRGRAHGGSNFTSLRKTSGRGEREGKRAAIMGAGGEGIELLELVPIRYLLTRCCML